MCCVRCPSSIKYLFRYFIGSVERMRVENIINISRIFSILLSSQPNIFFSIGGLLAMGKCAGRMKKVRGAKCEKISSNYICVKYCHRNRWHFYPCELFCINLRNIPYKTELLLVGWFLQIARKHCKQQQKSSK